MGLHESALLEDIVTLLYHLLPASGAPVTFGTIAHRLGLRSAWDATAGQSKKPRMRALLTASMQSRMFPRLVEEVVSASLGYRVAKGNPLTYDEVMSLKDLCEQLGHPVPGLADARFLQRLAGAPNTTAPDTRTVASASSKAGTPLVPQPDDTRARQHASALSALKDRFLALAELADRQEAGQALNGLLTDLFRVSGLEPSEPFRVVGEEIDGALYFHQETYLIEAKWWAKPTSAQPLYAFNEKIRRKSDFTRGIFISINGYTHDALTAFTTGAAPRAVLLDGAHLMRVLDGALSLPVLLLRVTRELAQRGRIYLPVSEL